MFKHISLNDNKVKQKKRNDYSTMNQQNHFEYGLPEWSQEWTTSKIKEQNLNNEWKNKSDLSHIPYLKPNHSQVKIDGFPAKEPFNSIFQKDYKKYDLDVLKSNKCVTSKKKELMNASQIVLGNDLNKNKKSNYLTEHCDPKKQISKFNYDKIEFSYDKYILNPITNEIISKPTHNNWGFEYFNRDKDKKQTSNDKPQALNTDFKRVYNPITNRYFN